VRTIADAMMTSPLNEVNFAATSLKREWRRCYLDALGFQELDDEFEKSFPAEGGEVKRSRIAVVNLLRSSCQDSHVSSSSRPPHAAVDQWTETAVEVQNNILEMAAWIQKKKWDFVSVNMPDEEASIIGSTVTAFIPTTANEIESLRQMAHATERPTQQQHRMGIVQILMILLKEEVADPFQTLQKQRSRTAVTLWQNPLQCRLMVPCAAMNEEEEDELDAALGISSSLSSQTQRSKQCFLPSRPSHLLQRGFRDAYKDLPRRKQRPSSLLFNKPGSISFKSTSKKDKPLSGVTTRDAHQRDAVAQSDVSDTSYYLSPPALKQESLLLAVNHDLDSVQQMEQRMMDITQLLSQFASLVSEQQEFVQDIYETTSDAKSNVEKGQEELVKAKETAKASKHFMAKAITSMGVALLILHWIKP